MYTLRITTVSTRSPEAWDFKAKQLMKFNEVPEDFPLQEGDIVYLEKKKKKADKPNYDHVVQVGESMHSIAQMYGIQIKSLYKMNKKAQRLHPGGRRCA